MVTTDIYPNAIVNARKQTSTRCCLRVGEVSTSVVSSATSGTMNWAARKNPTTRWDTTTGLARRHRGISLGRTNNEDGGHDDTIYLSVSMPLGHRYENRLAWEQTLATTVMRPPSAPRSAARPASDRSMALAATSASPAGQKPTSVPTCLMWAIALPAASRSASPSIASWAV